MALVELKNVSYAYANGFLAVDGVSFCVEAGENLAIVGQNGAGKTTTVKMLNGLIKPSKGEVLIEGEPTRAFTTAQMARKVGYVFQNPDDQIFNSTVYKEMEYGLKRMKIMPEERKRRILDAAELTGMTEYLEENPYDLSLAVRKFVTIALVIATDCQVLVFDEPTAGQDLDGLKRLGLLNRELTKRGKALITITHDMEFVAENFERLIVMCQKKVLADGRTEDLFYRKDLLEQAGLKQPCIVTLAGEAGMSERTLETEAVGNCLLNERRFSLPSERNHV